MKVILSIACVLALGLGIGCASLSDYITPATVDQHAVEYAASAGVVDANDFRGYANLEKAIRLEVAVNNAYEVKTLALTQMQEKNQLDYGVFRGVTVNNTKIAREREAALFGETGILSMGLSLLGVGGLGGVIGLMRKRPGDITPQEFEQTIADIKGEVTIKDRQFVEVVKGVQNFLNGHAGEAIATELKAAISTVRSADTKEAIALAKAVIS
jgi:hypothetical protein